MLIDLSAHELNAIQEIPQLHKDHMQDIGVQVRKETLAPVLPSSQQLRSMKPMGFAWIKIVSVELWQGIFE